MERSASRTVAHRGGAKRLAWGMGRPRGAVSMVLTEADGTGMHDRTNWESNGSDSDHKISCEVGMMALIPIDADSW